MDKVKELWERIPKHTREAIKEALRVILFVFISIFVSSLIAKLDEGNATLQGVSILVLTSFLKAVDKYIHEYGKEKGIDILVKGLTRF